MVYENDIELNQLLSTYKIAFANLSAYIVQEYFPGLTISIEKLINNKGLPDNKHKTNTMETKKYNKFSPRTSTKIEIYFYYAYLIVIS